MDLNNRLKELNELPIDQKLKKEIYGKITKRSNKFTVWKEVVLLGAIAAITLFLVILPSITPPLHQANNQSIEAIYAYEKAKEDKFFARSSTLYFGVEEIDEPQLTEFFEHYTDYVQPSTGNFDTEVPIDVVVLRNGVEERWKLFWSGILNVDTGEVYKANNRNDYGKMITSTFFNGESDLNYKLFYSLLLLALVVNIIPLIIYKRRGKGEKNPLQFQLKFGIFSLLLYLSFIFWQYQVGPIYKPILIPVALLFLLVEQFFVKRLSTSQFVHRVEFIRNSILMLLLIFMIFSF